MWFYSTVFWLFYHSTFFNYFIFKLIHPLNIACLAGCLFLVFFWCVFSFAVHKEIRFRHTKAELRTTKETMGEGARGEGWEKNHLQSTPRDFEMPHPVLWKEKLGLHMIWCVLKSDVSQQTVVPKICWLWLSINFFVVVYQSSLLTI